MDQKVLEQFGLGNVRLVGIRADISCFGWWQRTLLLIVKTFSLQVAHLLRASEASNYMTLPLADHIVDLYLENFLEVRHRPCGRVIAAKSFAGGE